MSAELRSYPRLPGCGADCWQDAHGAESHEGHGFMAGFMAGRLSMRPRIVRTGCLVVDLDAGLAYVSGRSAHLTATEWKILVYLTERVGRVCPHAGLITAVWGPEYVDDHGRHMVRVNVARIRKALGKAAGLITMTPDIGYTLLATAPILCVLVPEPMEANGRWARGWDRCRDCETTDRPHQARGRCGPCHSQAWRDARRGKP